MRIFLLCLPFFIISIFSSDLLFAEPPYQNSPNETETFNQNDIKIELALPSPAEDYMDDDDYDPSEMRFEFPNKVPVDHPLYPLTDPSVSDDEKEDILLKNPLIAFGVAKDTKQAMDDITTRLDFIERHPIGRLGIGFGDAVGANPLNPFCELNDAYMTRYAALLGELKAYMKIKNDETYPFKDHVYRRIAEITVELKKLEGDFEECENILVGIEQSIFETTMDLLPEPTDVLPLKNADMAKGIARTIRRRIVGEKTTSPVTKKMKRRITELVNGAKDGRFPEIKYPNGSTIIYDPDTLKPASKNGHQRLRGAAKGVYIDDAGNELYGYVTINVEDMPIQIRPFESGVCPKPAHHVIDITGEVNLKWCDVTTEEIPDIPFRVYLDGRNEPIGVLPIIKTD